MNVLRVLWSELAYNWVMKPALIIIAKEGYQDQEFEGTRRGLAAAGSLPRVVGRPSEGAIGGTGRRGN